MGWNHGDTGGGQWLAMGLMMVLFWGVLAAVVLYAVRSLRSHPAHPFPDHQQPHGLAPAGPEQVLAERFARGEIDEEEFTRRREVLRAP